MIKKEVEKNTKKEIQINYDPQPLQQILHNSSANEILFGGAAGPGKSHALRFEALKWCLLIPGLQVHLFRRTFPELDKSHILTTQIQYPHEAGTYKQQPKRWEFLNGSMLHFGSVQYERDVFAYQSTEIHLLIIDELTSFLEFQYNYLKCRVRCTLDIPEKYRHKIPGIICASNPGGVGHEFVKRIWIDNAPPNKIRKDEETGMYRQYIPGKIKDNPILMQADPGYIKRLDALPEPYRSAYKNGDWDIFLGQMFAFNRLDHVMKPIPVPEDKNIYMTFDWGFGRPYSVGWWWFDDDGRAFRFSELYGCRENSPDTGVRETDPEIAERIIEHEEKNGIKGKNIIRLSDPTCFNRKPDYQKGGQVPSTADEFAKLGIILRKGNADRSQKIKQFHARLRKIPGEMPMMMIYENCREFIRTIPMLQSDMHNPEDVDKKLEDHIYDEACHVLMARPMAGVGTGLNPLDLGGV